MVRPDGGRPDGRGCAHTETPDPAAVPHRDVCRECAARGRRWVRLRLCLSCGHVGCCDSSPGGHADAHHRATGHPVMCSAEPGEEWAWCYVDEVYLEPRDAEGHEGGPVPR
ncbi:UBP-type zinc finger domain-containing protein [Streptomyces chromofuscus]|uniref:UBP-type zinc finger domain-containing protein n=1 Tax=Streptomyces chromofuscus TaxID=42881 RepID=A0A7M2TGD4_STRCW|nr:UBP-type zinc finger domain-containing protein [Streptomyces chromofuscus]